MSDHNQHTLKDVINQLISKYPLKDKLSEVRMKELWESSMGPYIAKHTISLRFIHGKLLVHLDNAALKTELLFNRTNILQKLNKTLGENAIKELIIK